MNALIKEIEITEAHAAKKGSVFTGWSGKLVFLGGLVTLFHQLYLHFHWGGDEYVNNVNNIFLVLTFSCVFAFVFRTSRHPSLLPRTKKAWRCFALAYLSYLIGTMLWAYFEVVSGTKPFPSWADLFYLAFYALMFWGLLIVAGEKRSVQERLKLMLDAGIVTVGNGMLLWYFLLEPIARARTENYLMKILSLAYPVGDLVLLFGISIVLFDRQTREPRQPMNLLMVSVSIIFFADILFGFQNISGTYQSGTLADSLFTVSGFIAILAAQCKFVRSQSAVEALGEIPKERKALFWLPYLAVAAGYSPLLYFAAKNVHDVLSQLTGLAGVLIALVVLRQLIAIAENIKSKKILKELQERFQGIYHSSRDAIGFTDFNGVLIEVNASFVELLGYTRDELLGKSFDDLMPSEYRQLNSQHVRQSIELDQPAEFEGEYVRKDGRRVLVSVTSYTVKGDNGEPMGLAAIIRDVTERKRSEEQLMHHALHDALTGLPNRKLFLEHLRAAINRRVRRPNLKFAVLFLDFDRFKFINDSLGHLEGDKLLILISDRLRKTLRSGDIVARLGGDEFTVLLDSFDVEADVRRIVGRLEEALKEPFQLTEREIVISASIGIAVSHSSYTKPDEMLRDADTAMYYAKAAGKARHQFFTCKMHEVANTRLRLENEMRPALARGEFSLFYQPIIELETNRIQGFEALVRWIHPERGIISPDEFIPIAEETGFIIELGKWILHQSCWQLRRWQRQNPSYADWTVSVNLSSRQFQQLDLATTVAVIFKETKLLPEFLHIEVTESNIMDDNKAAIEVMNCMQALGVKISIDDFGTGYSSLSFLHHLPIDFLKIDRSFVIDMLEHPKNAKIIRTILMLAQSLGIEVIAEGIETRQQLEQLKLLGCRRGQGYYFSPPISAQQIDEWLEAEYFPANSESEDKGNNYLALQNPTVADFPVSARR